MHKHIIGISKLLFGSALIYCFSAYSALAQALCNNPNSPRCAGNAVPELDGSMGPLAVALLAGVIGIAVERKRRKTTR